jgi:hypothetical protein
VIARVLGEALLREHVRQCIYAEHLLRPRVVSLQTTARILDEYAYVLILFEVGVEVHGICSGIQYLIQQPWIGPHNRSRVTIEVRYGYHDMTLPKHRVVQPYEGGVIRARVHGLRNRLRTIGIHLDVVVDRRVASTSGVHQRERLQELVIVAEEELLDGLGLG